MIAPPAAGALLVSFSIPVLLLPPLERGGAHRPRAATSRAGAPALAPPAPPPGWSPALLRFLAATIFYEHPGFLARCTFKAKLAPHSSVSSSTIAAAKLKAMPQDQVQGSPVAGQLGKLLGQEQCWLLPARPNLHSFFFEHHLYPRSTQFLALDRCRGTAVKVHDRYARRGRCALAR